MEGSGVGGVGGQGAEGKEWRGVWREGVAAVRGKWRMWLCLLSRYGVSRRGWFMARNQGWFRDTIHGEGKRYDHKVHYKCIIPELRTFIP